MIGQQSNDSQYEKNVCSVNIYSLASETLAVKNIWRVDILSPREHRFKSVSENQF